MRLALGARRQVRVAKKGAVFEVQANKDEGTKRIQFHNNVKIRTTGTLVLGGLTLAKTGTIGNIAPGDGWIEVLATSTTFQTFILVGSGNFEIKEPENVSYLYLRDLTNEIKLTGDISAMALTSLYLYNLGTSEITGDISAMALTYLYLFNLGTSEITGDIKTNSIISYIAINSVPPIQRASWANDFVVKTLTNTTAFSISGAPTKLNARESEGLLHAGYDLAINNKTWAGETGVKLSVVADPLDPPDYSVCLPYMQAIINYGKPVAVPAEWGWTIPEAEE